MHITTCQVQNGNWSKLKLNEDPGNKFTLCQCGIHTENIYLSGLKRVTKHKNNIKSKKDVHVIIGFVVWRTLKSDC